MAGFLRKKNKPDEKQGKANFNSTPSNRTSNTPLVTPLYARFATTSPVKQDASPSLVSRPSVSGPMSLASGRRAGPTSPGSGGGGHPKVYGYGSTPTGSGFDVRTQKLGQSNASGSGYLSPQTQPSSPGVVGIDYSRPPQNLQGGSSLPSSASHGSMDKPLPPAADSVNPAAKDRHPTKSLPSSSNNAVDKPLPVPISKSTVTQQPSPSRAWHTNASPAVLDTESNNDTTNANTIRYPDGFPHKGLLPSQLPSNIPITLNTNPNAYVYPPTHKPGVPPSPSKSQSSPVSRPPNKLTSSKSKSAMQHPPSSSLSNPPSPKKPLFSRISLSGPRTTEGGPVTRASLDQLPSVMDRHGLSPKNKGKGRISLDDPVDVRDQGNKDGYVSSTRSRTSIPKPISPQSTGHTTSTAPTTFGDFWLPDRQKPGSVSSRKHIHHAASMEQNPSFGTTASSSAAHSGLSSFSVPSSGSAPLISAAHPNGVRHDIPGPTNPPYLVHPNVSPTHTNPNPPHQGYTDPSNPPQPSTPLTIHSEFKEYSDLIQNLGAIGQSPAPAPALTLPPATAPTLAPDPESAPVTQAGILPAKQASKSGRVVHARQTSIQMRKGPLIFATASEPAEAASVKVQPTPSSPQAAQPPETPPKPNSVQNGSPGVYPSPPAEYSSLLDEAAARSRHRQRLAPTESDKNFYPSTVVPNQVNQPHERTQNRSVPAPSALPRPPPRSPHRPPTQIQQSPSQIPRPLPKPVPPQKSQTSLSPQRDTQNQNASPKAEGQDHSSLFGTQPSPHRVLTKGKQPSAKPATPPTSPKKHVRRLDPSPELNDQARTNSGTSSHPNSDAKNEVPEPPQMSPAAPAGDASVQEAPGRQSSHPDLGGQGDDDALAMKRRSNDVNNKVDIPFLKAPPTPDSPHGHSGDQSPRGSAFETQPPPPPPPLVADSISQLAASAGPYEPVIPKVRARPMTGISMSAEFSLFGFLSDAGLLFNLLGYLSFYDWIVLSSISKQIRNQLQEERDLREEVLERYLDTIGYERWGWGEPEPLALSLRDLNHYMRGVSLPNHQYARLAEQYLQLRSDDQTIKAAKTIMRECATSTIAYTRVVVRLRSQAEAAEAEYIAQHIPGASYPVSAFAKSNGTYSTGHLRGNASRPSSRAPSPALSTFSHSHHGHSAAVINPMTGTPQTSNPQHRGTSFRSPLFKLRRAPLLRVFVPSPDGDWLSDASVLECETQLKRAGVSKLLRPGDVVWDVAVGDEGNVGRLIWDGNFLIDLDYTYSTSGDLPQYLHTLAFPPSYFHRVIRTSPANSSHGSNPIVHINISPWGEEIAANLQLLQDRMRTETPQGSRRNVVRWVHRSSFLIRPPPAPIAARYGPNRTRIPPARISIPQTDLFIDPGWYGTVVVEAEGTNEGLADLQERCGSGVFPSRSKNVIRNPGNLKPRDGRKVFRLLREKSHPGEIWLRAVGEKERLM